MQKFYRRLLLVAPLAIGSVFVTWWSLWRAPRELSDPLPLEYQGVRFSKLTATPDSGFATLSGRANDFLLTTHQAQVIVAGLPDNTRSARAGQILDFVARDWGDDRLRGLATVTRIDGQLAPLLTEHIEPDTTGPQAALVVTQTASFPKLRVVTRIEPDTRLPRLRLISTLTNTGAEPVTQVQLGDTVSWPGTPTYAPRAGFVTEAARLNAPWLAREGNGLSYGLVFHDEGAVTDFRFDRVGSTDNETLVWAESVAPGATLSYSRSLLITRDGLTGIAAMAYGLLGKPLGRAFGQLRVVPPWAIVEARRPDGKPLAETRVGSDGRFQFTLPEGSYDLVLKTAGGTDQERVELGAGAEVQVSLLPPAPGRLRYWVVDESSRPLAARLSIRGVPPTPNPDFGARELAQGIRNVTYSASGTGELELPPGTFRVFISHGFEYALFDKEIVINPETGASVRASLGRVVDTRHWISGDFHLHAAPSFDSTVSLIDRVTSLAAEGVEFAVATDHNHVTDYSGATRQASLEQVLSSSSGVEITTVGRGHFIAFPYPVALPPPPFEGLTPGQIFAHVRERASDAVIQINHPRMGGIGYFSALKYPEELARGVFPSTETPDAGLDSPESILPARGRAATTRVHDQNTIPPQDPKAGREATPAPGQTLGDALLSVSEGFSFDFDSVEVINGFELNNPAAIEKNLQDWFALLNVGRRYTAVGNSDSHSLVHWAGYPRTYVLVDDDDPARVRPEDIAAALRQGRAQISNGIFIEVTLDSGATPGDQVTVVDPVVQLKVLARAAPYVDVKVAQIWVNGNLVAETRRVGPPTQALRLGWVSHLTLVRDSWIVVMARGENPLGPTFPGGKGQPFAITNPIFVDVDGDGVFTAPLAPPPQAIGVAPPG